MSNISLKKIIQVIFYSLIYSLGMSIFLIPMQLIATGVAGITQILTYLVPSVSYATFYLALNIPGIYLGFQKLGFSFTTYSLISILTVSISSSLIPPLVITNDILLNCIFAGMVMGYSLGSLLKIGASSGGTDFWGIWIQRKFDYDFVKINFSINVAIIITAIFLFNLEIGMYTLVSFYIRNLTINQIFINNNKMTVWIIAEDLNKVSKYINENLGHGTTIIKGAGGYTHKEKEIIMTILTQYEYSILIDKINLICPDAFVNVTETFKIQGNFKRKGK